MRLDVAQIDDAARERLDLMPKIADGFLLAEVPLGEMFGYSTTVRSLTQGRATYTMEFKHYSEAPKSVSEAVISAKTK